MTKQDKPIEVIAIQDGHYGGQYRKKGARFTVKNPDKELSKRWMAPADSQKAKDFQKALGKREDDLDKVTGERVKSGGLSEQLAVTMDENRALKGRVAELEKQVDELTSDVTTPVPPVTPAEQTGNDEATNASTEATAVNEAGEAPKRRTRSRTSKK